MEFFGHIIDGREIESADGARMPSVDPYLREPWAEAAVGGAADADRAVGRRAGGLRRPGRGHGWATRAASRLLHALADLIDARATELGMADTRDMGKPIDDARGHDVPRFGLELPVLRRPRPDGGGRGAAIRHRPPHLHPVRACRGGGRHPPWNFPLMLETWKVARRWPGATP